MGFADAPSGSRHGMAISRAGLLLAVYRARYFFKESAMMNYSKQWGVAVLCAVLAGLSACAGSPWRGNGTMNSAEMQADLQQLRAKLDEVKAGDFGEFLSELRYAEAELSRAENLVQTVESRGGDIEQANQAVQQALEHRGNAEDALTRILMAGMDTSQIEEIDERLNYLESLHFPAKATPPVIRIYFGQSSSHLLNSERQKLADMLDFLRQYPVFAIKLIGYADTVGDRAQNTRLAERRNRSVLESLRRLGLPPNTVVTVAVGEGKGPDETSNPENRRVEIRPYVHGRYIYPGHSLSTDPDS
jgi:outer membrane protein OmpA-like peptidoglycan-associated protein